MSEQGLRDAQNRLSNDLYNLHNRHNNYIKQLEEGMMELAEEVAELKRQVSDIQYELRTDNT